ncbi:TerB N-terminal domain-containing protein [Salinisphaera hydrothermalis]|uniref:tellurite resistance TerB family protein n=1 Tax=Salinisphaera hydrothermalis TaxID=563188 RepID=UPI00333FBC23
MATFVSLIVSIFIVGIVIASLRARRTVLRTQFNSRDAGPAIRSSSKRSEDGLDRVRSSDSTSTESQSHRAVHQAHDGTPQQRNTEDCWIPAGVTTLIHGLEIPGGLIYVGRGLAAARGYAEEPALIDPERRADLTLSDHAGTELDYWPSYASIPPKSRGAYLHWLAGGRCASDAYIGYVFLFFYGLERRVLSDRIGTGGYDDEHCAIRDEVERLLTIYGTNGSFRFYATQFLSTMELLGMSSTDQLPRLYEGRSYEMPLQLKVGLGRLVQAHKPISTEWALAWVMHDPEISLRTPAQRCPKLFTTLFRHLYAERFGDGMIIKPNKTKITPTYRPASPGFAGLITIPIGHSIIDITVLKRPRNALIEIANEAMNQLDAYSRHIGRNDDSKTSLHAIALLPDAVVTGDAFPALKHLNAAVKPCFAETDFPAVPVRLLFKHFGMEIEEKLAKKEAVLLAQALEKIDIGLSPDTRFSGIKPKPTDDVVLFRLSEDAPTAPSSTYQATALLIRLSCMVSIADGEIAPDECRAMDTLIDGHEALNHAERTRLHAYKNWLLTHEEGSAGLKAQLDALTAAQTQALGEHLITIAAADGRIDRDEIQMLEKLYKKLGLDAAQILPALHSRATSGPVSVREAKEEKGFAIPQPPEQQNDRPIRTTVQELDQAALEKKLADTERVSALLTGIFAEAEDDVTSARAAPDSALNSQVAETIADLDPAHSAMLSALGTQEAWSRSELETLAQAQGLLLDGALDTINEAAFEQCDAPCIEEDDDGYKLDREIYEELLA